MHLLIVRDVLEVVVVVGGVTYGCLSERRLEVLRAYHVTSGNEVVHSKVCKDLLVEDILQMFQC